MDGQVQDIVKNKMAKKTKAQIDHKQKLQHAVDLLKFVLTLDDMEIIKTASESIIEILEVEINK
jgi:hypothetical protein